MNTNALLTPAQAILEAAAGNPVELSKGVYLSSQESMSAEQMDWSEEDGAMAVDFSAAPFWISDDSGMEPIAVYDADDADLIKALAA